MRITATIIGIALATAALGAMPAAAREKEVQKVMPNGEKILCKWMETTGSLMARKSCYTRSEWDRIAEAARANGQRMVNDHTSGPSGN